MSDDEVIEAEPSQELVVTGGAPVTLFKTDDPVEIVTKATAVANALADVLKNKKLTTKISGRDYVQVEGWTLCGSMLGVFPVVEWTRPIVDETGQKQGWEARVEARRSDGAVVGAAEAECMRDERRWSTADDYSIRSMAQTRAISKALRAPLGFIVALAGYETTPEAEMVEEPAAAKRFDPETDLLPGAISGSDAPQRLRAALDGFDPTVDWSVVVNDVSVDHYGSSELKKLKPEEYADFWRRLSNAVQWITDRAPAGDFPPVEGEIIKKGFAYGFGGIELELTYKEAVEKPEGGAPLSTEQAAEIDEVLEADADDIEF